MLKHKNEVHIVLLTPGLDTYLTINKLKYLLTRENFDKIKYVTFMDYYKNNYNYSYPEKEYYILKNLIMSDSWIVKSSDEIYWLHSNIKYKYENNFFPYRNLKFQIDALSYIQTLYSADKYTMYVGCMKDDAVNDNNLQYIQLTNKLLNNMNDHCKIEIKTIFSQQTKHEALREAIHLYNNNGINTYQKLYNDTYSCYSVYDNMNSDSTSITTKPCGACSACLRTAFTFWAAEKYFIPTNNVEKILMYLERHNIPDNKKLIISEYYNKLLEYMEDNK